MHTVCKLKCYIYILVSGLILPFPWSRNLPWISTVKPRPLARPINPCSIGMSLGLLLTAARSDFFRVVVTSTLNEDQSGLQCKDEGLTDS
jgi:hypothetical protein